MRSKNSCATGLSDHNSGVSQSAPSGWFDRWHWEGAMDSDLVAPRSRRALLAAAAAAGGALVASAALPLSAAAHDVDDVALGIDNPTTTTTSITDSGADSIAL